MQIQEDKPLSKPMMIFRSVVAVLLIFGSLLPLGGMIQIAAAVIALPIVLAEIARQLTRLYLHNAVLIVVVLFAALLIPGLFTSAIGTYGHEKLLDLATLSLFTALAASIIRDPAHLRVFAGAWVGFGVVVAVLTLTGGTGIAERAIAAGANPIGLARALAVAVIAAVWLMLNSRLRPAPGLLLLMVFGLAIFATGSKGPVLGAGLSVFVMVLANSGKRSLRLIQAGLAAGLVYLGVALIPQLRDSRLGQFMLDPLSVQDPIRTLAIDGSMEALTAQGWMGHGYGSWSWVSRVHLMEYPHNIWLELAVEAGIISTLIIATALVVIVARLVLTATPSAQLAAAWLVTEAVSASLSGDVRARAFWFFLVLGYLVVRWGRDHSPNTSPGVSKNRSSNVVVSSHPASRPAATRLTK